MECHQIIAWLLAWGVQVTPQAMDREWEMLWHQHDIHADVPLTNERIKSIHVPTEIHRRPRGLNDLKHWKGLLALKKLYPIMMISLPMSTLILH